MKKLLLSASAALALTPALAFAQEAAAVTTGGPALAGWGLIIAGIGAALATAIPCLGSILGVSMVGQAGAGLLTEKPELAGKVITLAVLPGSQGLYGMVISLLFIFNYGPVITATVPLTLKEGLVLFIAFIPVAFTCVTSAIFQAKVCVSGLHMLAKDGKLAGRVITMAALVETYALLGFLISFFLLNTFRAAVIGAA
ncbi:MAG: V-type ATP synthase subunit K [Candidatus Peribacteraceae bacterium]